MKRETNSWRRGEQEGKRGSRTKLQIHLPTLCAATPVETATEGSGGEPTPVAALNETDRTNQGATHRLSRRKEAYNMLYEM